MYAIIQTGGKQYRVAQGDVIQVELLGQEGGNVVTFKQVLFLSHAQVKEIGTPYLTRCLVKGEVLGEVKGPKVVAFKYKRRKGYHRKVGHRQRYTKVKITEISTPLGKEEHGT